jgi:hypothetical protein
MRHFGEALEFGGGQKALCAPDFEWCFGPNHRGDLLFIKSVIKTNRLLAFPLDPGMGHTADTLGVRRSLI